MTTTYPPCQADSVALLDPCPTGQDGVHEVRYRDTWLCTPCMREFLYRRDKLQEALQA